MAVEYFLYTSLKPDELSTRIAQAKQDAGDTWVHASADELHSQTVLMLKEDYGYPETYRSTIYIRHNKFRTEEARLFTKDFFDALPNPKIAMLNGKIVDPATFWTTKD